MEGIEPSPHAWQAGILTVILHIQNKIFFLSYTYIIANILSIVNIFKIDNFD